MLAREVLEKIQLGLGVAESDKELERYFVATPAFREVLRDEVHVVLGVKGSGKTAISRVLAGGKLEVPELASIIMVSAFQTQADTPFVNLPDEVDESTFRQLWLAYFVSLGAQAVLQRKLGDATVRSSLTRSLQDVDILPDEAQGPDRVLRSMIQRISPLPTHDSGPAGSAGPDLGQSRWLSPDYDFAPLVASVSEAIGGAGLQCWILLDRLDEAFGTRPQLVTPALRGLLRAHLDLLAWSDFLKTKIFLRSDIYTRVTQHEGFLNLDHILDVTLTWRRSEIIELIAQRLRASAAAPALNAPTLPAHELVDRMVPGQVTYFTGRRHATSGALDWCIEMTAARRDEPSPRNVLRMLREAQRTALVRLISSNEEHDPLRPLLRDADLVDAWPTVSKARLTDSIYAEANHLRPYVESFRHTPMRATRNTLVTRFREVSPECDANALLEELVSRGFLYQDGAGSFDVAPLYLPALDIGVSSSPKQDRYRVVSSDLKGSTPERLRDVAKELAGEGQLQEAVQLLIEGYTITSENAVLACNIAVQSRDRESLKNIDSLFEREEFAKSLIGKRIAVKYALRIERSARSLADSISQDEELDDAYGSFIGSLTFDSSLEDRVWRSLLESRDWESVGASKWSRLIPPLASSRMLAVVRGRQGAAEYNDAILETFNSWFPSGVGSIAPSIQEFLMAYLEDFRTTVVGVFPYQLVSMAAVLRVGSLLDPQMEEALAASLVRHVGSSAEKHQRSFRDWAAYDELARSVVERLA